VRLKIIATVLTLGWAGAALAQTAVETREVKEVVVVKEEPKAPAFVFEMHGFVSGSLLVQDNSGNNYGQKWLFAGPMYTSDKALFTGDVRQTRLNFSVRGPKVFGGATPKAVVEFDMFGSDEVNAGTAASATVGANGDVSILPRIRTAYAELNWGNHTLAFGQMNMLTITLIPESLTHIAFPVSYAAGTIGWRAPGIWGYHTFGNDFKLEFAWSIQRSQWINNVASVTAANGQNAGTASGIPAFEARLRAMFGKTFSLWVTGHYQQEDMNGPNVLEAVNGSGTRSSTMTTYAYTAGMKLAVSLLTLQGSAWYGMNTGPLLGNIVQFPANQVSVHGWGAWGQLGLDFTKNFSLWLMYGVDIPNPTDARSAGMARLQNNNAAAMLRYSEGGFGIGLEYVRSQTLYANYQYSPGQPVVGAGGTGPGSAVGRTQVGQQLALTANYAF